MVLAKQWETREETEIRWWVKPLLGVSVWEPRTHLKKGRENCFPLLLRRGEPARRGAGQAIARLAGGRAGSPAAGLAGGLTAMSTLGDHKLSPGLLTSAPQLEC